MSTVDKLILANENLVFSTKKHLVIFSSSLIWTVITLLFCVQRTPFITGPITLPFFNAVADLAWLPGLLALFSWGNQTLTYLTSTFLVTDRRVIMREGFFFRHATETRLSAVAEVKISQSLLGRLLDFGTITINSFGGGAEVFKVIAAPYAFQKQVLGRLDKQ
jgi:uncharacterized membrane protein YdbT with pleckstrin-like domain